MTGFATMTSKNQVTLPADMVRILSWPAGTQFWVDEKDRKVVLERISGLRDVQGVLASHSLAQKYTTDEIIGLARKKKIARLYKK